MSWQLLLAIHLLLTAAFALIYRRTASNLKGFGRIVTAIMYIGVILPGGIAVALWQGDISFGFSAFSWLLFAIVGVLFAGINFLSYRANEELDAAQFAIITNLQALFVIAIAGLFLGERLSGLQLLGALLLVIAAVDVAVDKVGPRTFRLKSASLLALGSSLMLAAAVTIEKALLNEVSFSTYLIVGWGAQSVAIGTLAFRDRKLVRTISRRQLFEVLGLGLLRLGQGLTFIAAITLVEVSVAASVRSYKPILVFIAALIFLGEKRDVRRKAIGAVLATVGLLLLV